MGVRSPSAHLKVFGTETIFQDCATVCLATSLKDNALAFSQSGRHDKLRLLRFWCRSLVGVGRELACDFNTRYCEMSATIKASNGWAGC